MAREVPRPRVQDRRPPAGLATGPGPSPHLAILPSRESPPAACPVLLIPGFLCGDASMRPLAAALEAHGHPVHPSGIACNVDCSEAALGPLLQLVGDLAAHHGAPVAVVGHSRGGLFARVIARRRPDLVSAVVTLGTPHRDPQRTHPWLWAQALALSVLGSLGFPGTMTVACGLGACCAAFWRDVAAPPPPTVRVLSIYSTIDRMVDWRACLEHDGRHAEVRAGHYELPGHAATLPIVLAALAGAANPRAPGRRAGAAGSGSGACSRAAAG
jgi:pimeloyl-ACP methyl ester carboxylesterase